MARFMTSGKIGSLRQDVLTHVRIMLGRHLTPAEVRLADSLRREGGYKLVEIAERVAALSGAELVCRPRERKP